MAGFEFKTKGKMKTKTIILLCIFLLVLLVSLSQFGLYADGSVAKNRCAGMSLRECSKHDNCEIVKRRFIFVKRQKCIEKSSTPSRLIKPGDYQKSINIEGVERTYLLHIPLGYDPNKKYPLVMVFHGGGGTGQQVATKTGFNTYADRDGFIVLYPNGIENSWNDRRGTTKSDKQGIDDVGFVSALIEHLTTIFPIDKNRIYASGISNGAIFSHRLACKLSSKIAAIGVVAGEIPEAIVSSCGLSSPMSRIAIHGVADPLNPFLGGETRGGGGGRILSAQATAEIWAKHNGCSLTPSKTQVTPTVNDGTSVEKWAYPNCKKGVDVILYAVNGMGHAWPPQDPEVSRISGKTSHNIDTTKVIWAFFKSHSKV